MNFINTFCAIVAVAAFSLAAYGLVEKDISVHDLIDYSGALAEHVAGETGEVLEAVVTVACTTLVRTEVSPLVSHDALIGFAESITQLRCGAYIGQYSASESISIPKGFVFDWMKRDGYAELWISANISVPIVMDLSTIDVSIDRGQDSVRITYDLPSPILGQPRIDFSRLRHNVDEVKSMSNDEIAEASDSLFNMILGDACAEVTNEAIEDGAIERVRSNLSRDLISFTNSIYPDASVQINFMDTELDLRESQVTSLLVEAEGSRGYHELKSHTM